MFNDLEEMDKVRNKIITLYQQSIETIKEYNALLKESPEEHSFPNKVVSDWLDAWLFDMERLCELINDDYEHAKINFDLCTDFTLNKEEGYGNRRKNKVFQGSRRRYSGKTRRAYRHTSCFNKKI